MHMCICFRVQLYNHSKVKGCCSQIHLNPSVKMRVIFFNQDSLSVPSTYKNLSTLPIDVGT